MSINKNVCPTPKIVVRMVHRDVIFYLFGLKRLYNNVQAYLLFFPCPLWNSQLALNIRYPWLVWIKTNPVHETLLGVHRNPPSVPCVQKVD